MITALFNGATLDINLAEDFAFVHPECVPGYPARDPIIHGTATLTLSSARQVSQIKVVFEGLSDAYGGNGTVYESTTSLHKELVLDLKDELFEAGAHATPVPVYIIANPSPAGELPEPLDVSIQHFSEDLGPVGIGIASPYLTVAALLSTRVTLLGPPQPVDIIGIETYIKQQYKVSFNDSSRNSSPEPKRFRLRKVDPFKVTPSLVIPVCVNDCSPEEPRKNAAERILKSCQLPDKEPCCPVKPDVYSTDPTPLKQLRDNEGFHYSRTARVPTDDFVRPTTLPGTETRIRVGHKVVVEIRYRIQGETSDKVLVIGKDVTIASCCCWIDSLLLPAYSKVAPKDSSKRLSHICQCHIPLAEAVERDGAALVEAGSAFVLPTGADVMSSNASAFASAGDYSPSISSASSDGLKTPDGLSYGTPLLVDDAERAAKSPAYSETDGMVLPRYYSVAMRDEGI
ncbi:hypothetical protein OIV83_000319 [Microbotryomycetes sp. JL201]|nr:hypothetical protein OIV83_000319 [Microbotryomycetes sp. JL201]